VICCTSRRSDPVVDTFEIVFLGKRQERVITKLA